MVIGPFDAGSKAQPAILVSEMESTFPRKVTSNEKDQWKSQYNIEYIPAMFLRLVRMFYL
jgi:hypothetical protein